MEQNDQSAGRGDAQEWVRAGIARIESQNGSLKTAVRLLSFGFVLSFAAVAGLGYMLVTSNPDSTDVVETSALVLRDANGAARAELALGPDGAPQLTFMDGSEVERMLLTLRNGGAPGLVFADEDGNRRIVLGLLPDETGNMVFADREGTMRAVLGLSQDDRSNLVFADRSGVPRVGIGVDALGAATVMIPGEEEAASDDDTVPGG